MTIENQHGNIKIEQLKDSYIAKEKRNLLTYKQRELRNSTTIDGASTISFQRKRLQNQKNRIAKMASPKAKKRLPVDFCHLFNQDEIIQLKQQEPTQTKPKPAHHSIVNAHDLSRVSTSFESAQSKRMKYASKIRSKKIQSYELQGPKQSSQNKLFIADQYSPGRSFHDQEANLTFGYINTLKARRSSKTHNENRDRHKMGIMHKKYESNHIVMMDGEGPRLQAKRGLSQIDFEAVNRHRAHNASVENRINRDLFSVIEKHPTEQEEVVEQ